MSPVNKTDVFRGKLSLVRVIETAIDHAELHQNNSQNLALFVHRFSVQHRYWMEKNQSQEFEQNLIQLVTYYIRYLPIMIEEFHTQCITMGWQLLSHRTESVLKAFFEGIESNTHSSGVLALLDKVYFAHRVIEEFHDHIICKFGFPVLSWDMTMANLLVHQLLGTQYSSHLDQTAMELTQKLLDNLPAANSHTQKNQDKSWPCFCEQFNVSLSL